MANYLDNFDVAVIGAGHAGIEAALSAARLGMRTVIFSISLDCIANLPCNPSIGGTAKGHLVREIDALGGEMGKAADKTFLQSKMLNRGKGPAVHSLRCQIDRKRYHIEMKKRLESEKNLSVKQAEIIARDVCVQSMLMFFRGIGQILVRAHSDPLEHFLTRKRDLSFIINVINAAKKVIIKRHLNLPQRIHCRLNSMMMKIFS